LERTRTISRDAALPPMLDAGALRAGTRIGRYAILECIGRGGMAVVYRARDQDLQRTVALKIVLNPEGRAPTPRGQARMLREARASASVTHPNVVTVYDVGQHDDFVYIAMELMPGSLAQWLEAEERPWRHVLAVFIEAGRGLVAAHDAGLVHRDFKAANVLLAPGHSSKMIGHPKVADFGLALPVHEPASHSAEDASTDPPWTGQASITRLTATGTWVGTPGYMAPEQFTCGELDPRADQFSYCVALYRALYRQAPFFGRTADGLRRAAASGDVRPPPGDTPVPRWVQSAILRGLAAEPGDRWPTMTSLLRRLESGGRRRRRRLGLVSIGGAAALWGLVGGNHEDGRCRDDPQALVVVWNDRQGDEIERALAGTGSEFVRETRARFRSDLAAFSGRWKGVHRELCEGRHSAIDLDAAMACLGDQLAEASIVVDGLRTGERAEVARAAERLRILPAPALCLDPEHLARRVEPPPFELQARVESVRSRLRDAARLRETGQPRAAEGPARSAVAEANEIGYAPLRAAAHLELGRLEIELARPQDGVRSLEAAYAAAADAGDGTTLREAALGLVRVTAAELSQPDAALRWARFARAEVERSGDDPSAHADVLAAKVSVYLVTGRYDDAIEHAEHVLQIREAELDGDDPRIADAHVQLGIAALRAGDNEMADEQLTWALELQEQVLGPDHPRVAHTLNALGVIHGDSRGQKMRAIELYERALQILERAYGPSHPRLANPLQNLGNQLVGIDGIRANHSMERALALREEEWGPDHPALAGIHVALGNTFHALRRFDHAERHYRHALRLAESATGEQPALPLFALAWNYRDQGDFDRAIEYAEAGMARAPHDPDMTPLPHARARGLAGQLLWQSGRDRTRGAALGREACAQLEALGANHVLDLACHWLPASDD
jgi:eukaryotic-like serine/threonine-protein kinase